MAIRLATIRLKSSPADDESPLRSHKSSSFQSPLDSDARNWFIAIFCFDSYFTNPRISSPWGRPRLLLSFLRSSAACVQVSILVVRLSELLTPSIFCRTSFDDLHRRFFSLLRFALISSCLAPYAWHERILCARSASMLQVQTLNWLNLWAFKMIQVEMRSDLFMFV